MPKYTIDDVMEQILEINSRLTRLENGQEAMQKDIRLIKDCVATENAEQFPPLRKAHHNNK